MAQAQLHDAPTCRNEYNIKRGAVSISIQRVETESPTASVVLKVGTKSIKLDIDQWRDLVSLDHDIQFFSAFILGHIQLDTSE